MHVPSALPYLSSEGTCKICFLDKSYLLYASSICGPPDIYLRPTYTEPPYTFPNPTTCNKANLRDLIAATGLVISNWIQIVNFSARVTVKFDGWPCKTIGHLFYATSSFVKHFVPIGEFKHKLQSGNAQSGSNLTIFRAVQPWNLTDDLAKQ